MCQPEASFFQDLISGPLEQFILRSKDLGEPIYSVAQMVKDAFVQESQFIVVGITIPQPDDDIFRKSIQPICDAIQKITDFRNKNRKVEDVFNHLSTISESIVSLSWITVKPAPAQFIKDMREAGEYYGNRVLMAHKGEDSESSWIASWKQVLIELENYVRRFHLTGFKWNSAPLGQHGVPPPPPPPPPSEDPSFRTDLMREALLSELNQGENIARMLKPVRAVTSQNVHHAGGPHLQDSAKNVSIQPKKTPVHPPKLVLEGRRWAVEYHKNNRGLSVKANEMSESVQVFQCDESVVKIENKVNGVNINNCRKVQIILSDVISSVEIIRCNKVEIMCHGHVPLISIDNSESTQVFLTSSSMDAEIISSKSSSSNVCLLEKDGDYVEFPVPEQIRTVLINGKLSSTVLEHN